MKKIFIINGKAGSGKDTFIDMIDDLIPTLSYSIIDPIKETAENFGWNGEKDERSRKFLSDMKNALDIYNDYPYSMVRDIVSDFHKGYLPDFDFLFVTMREKKDIERAVAEFGAKTVLINRDVAQITSNTSDTNVFEFTDYDYIIYNNGSLDDLKEQAQEFIERICDEETE